MIPLRCANVYNVRVIGRYFKPMTSTFVCLQAGILKHDEWHSLLVHVPPFGSQSIPSQGNGPVSYVSIKVVIIEWYRGQIVAEFTKG